MRRRTRVLGGLALAAVAVLVLAAAALAADHAVTISGFAFAPASVTVTVGDTVTWTNQDATGHTATASDGSFDTGTIGANGTKSVTFATAGTFAYACSIHPTMTGTVVVEAASSGGGGGGGGAKPPATDTVATPGSASLDDPGGMLAGLLAVLGVAMVVGTVLFGRRRAERATD